MNRGTTVIWAGSAANLAFRFGQNILIARLAGIETMGLYAAVLVVPLLFARLCDLSLPHAASYFVRRDPRLLRSVWTLFLVHGAVVVLPASLAVVAIVGWQLGGAGDAWRVVQAHPAQLVMIMVVSAISPGALVLLLACGKSAAYAAVSVLPPALFCFGIVAVWFVVPLDPGELLNMHLLAEGVALACSATLVLRSIRRTPQGVPVKWRSLYSFGIRAHGGVCAKVIAQRADRVIIAALLPPAGMAAYVVAINVRDLLLAPANVYSTTFRQRLIDIDAKHGNALKVVGRVAAISTAIMVSLCLLAYLLAGTLIPLLYGEAFNISVPIVRVVVWSAVAVCLSGLLWNYYLAMNQPLLVTASTTVSALLGVLLIYILTRSWGTTGAAYAVLAASGIELVATAGILVLLVGKTRNHKRI